MTDDYTVEIEQLMAGLNRNIAEGHAVQSRDAAYAAYLKLMALREQSGISAEAERLLEQNCQKAWLLYEATWRCSMSWNGRTAAATRKFRARH